MKNVVIGILGTTLDSRGRKEQRWKRWRPTVSLNQHPDLPIDRLELIIDHHSQGLAKQLIADIAEVSPHTLVNTHTIGFHNPWDFESVYAALMDFSRSYHFDNERENYLVHMTTGTHVAQICWYLLTEAGYLPARLLQTSPPSKKDEQSPGSYQIIDLDLSKYDQIASRFEKEHDKGTTYLKAGIATRSRSFNRMIEQLEQVSVRSTEPILLTGPTGAGKSQLAKRIYQLRKQRGKTSGELVIVNCATLQGDNTMSALFGHKKGAFTGAISERPGLLREADQGLLFLDEIGELGLDEQAMLLRAIEEKRFMPLGSDKEISSDFQLIAGTNKNLSHEVQQGRFRADLLARIDLWSYRLPSLKERLEDLKPNIDYELEKIANKTGRLISFNKAAKARYLNFAQSPQALWSANFRDLNASITRMATLADGGRINEQNVNEEIQRLEQRWASSETSREGLCKQLLSQEQLSQLDYYEQIKLEGLLQVCRASSSMAEAGRRLFDKSREQKSSNNDSHRVKQLLAKYGLEFKQIQSAQF